MKKIIIIFSLLLMTGCTTPIDHSPSIEGYKVLGFWRPNPGDLIYVAGNSVITNESYTNCHAWVVEKE